jgi:formylmethanofuran dehydrogenase subunit D
MVRSVRGEIVGVARVEAGMREGVVSVPHGHEHANVNLLTDARAVDGLTGMVQYSGISVSVHALPAASA